MTAENIDADELSRIADRASMRPRPMTAENDDGQSDRGRKHGASMRPRPMTAENRDRVLAGPPEAACFNEAAADDRGKRPKSGSTRHYPTQLQ